MCAEYSILLYPIPPRSPRSIQKWQVQQNVPVGMVLGVARLQWGGSGRVQIYQKVAALQIKLETSKTQNKAHDNPLEL